MSNKRGGLGRGLGAIFGNQAAEISKIKPKDIVQEIFVSAVQPNRYQPRREFSPDALQELAESIKTYGILQPIIVRKLGLDSYELIAGERRLRATKIVGLEKIPAIIREYSDAQTSEISIIENVQRQNLNPIEEAQAYERLIRDFGHTQEELAAKIGCSRSHIANLLRMLNLSPQVREFLEKGLLTMGQARPLLAIENEILQTKAASMIVAEDLSVRKVETFITEMKNVGLIKAERAKKISVPKITKPEEKILPVLRDEGQETRDKEKISQPEIKVDKKPEPSAEKIEQPKKVEPSIEKVKQPEKFSEPTYENYVRLAEDKLTELVGTEVKIISEESKHQIQINFSDDAQLLQIVRKLERTIPNSGGKDISTKAEKISALRKFSTEGKI